MKNNEENIDKIVRDLLKSKDFGNPPKDFLDDLNKRLDEREPHGFFGPWNGVLDIILIILLFVHPLIQSGTVIQNRNLSQIKTEQPDTVSTLLLENKAKPVNKSSATTVIVPEENENINKQEQLSDQDLSSSIQNEERSNHSKPSTSKETSRIADNEMSKNTVSNKKTRNVINSNKNDTSLDIPKTHVNKKGSPSEIKIPTAQEKNEKKDQPYRVNNRENALVYATQYPIVESKIRNWNFPPVASAVNSLSSLALKNDNEIIVSPINWELQLSAGLNFPTLNNSNNPNNGSTLLLSQQSGFGPSFTLGGRISMWYNNIAITSGLDFLSIKEENLFELNEVQSYDSTYVTNVDTTVIFDSVNQTWDTTYTFDYDSTTVTDTILSTIPVSQQYSWIQIPLEVGYKFQFNKWAIIPRAGINLAIGIRQQNKAYPNESFDLLQTYSPSVKVLMNLTGSIEVRRDFNNWHAFVRGNYQAGMRPILTGNYFERRYNGFQLNMGIGITLGQ